MALGEWLRQVMVETSALKHRASSVARLMSSRQLVALRVDSASHSLLFVERDSLRSDFLFLAGPRPRVTELFRGNAVDLVLERSRLRLEAERADVVAAPWKYFEERPDTLRWYPFLDAGLAVAASVEDQLARVPLKSHQRQLRAAAEDPALKLRISRTHKDFDRFCAEICAPGLEEKQGLKEAFGEGGALALVEGRGRRLLAGALLHTRRRGTLSFHRSGLADAASLTAAQRAHRAAALEVAVFRHAQQAGFAILDLGCTPSVLTHPLFVQKRRLGCTFSPTPSSPALMLQVKPALRPSLFARAPLLTGEAGAFVVQAGLRCASRLSERALSARAKELDISGCSQIMLSTDGPSELPARMRCETVLREQLPRMRVDVAQF